MAQLAVDLDVTPSTIRRDLQRLARDGRLVRTYGGAALAEGLHPPAGPIRAKAAKRAIAHAAAALVPDGPRSSSAAGARRCSSPARSPTADLTVITNALDVANVLLDREGIELIVLGGVVRPRMHSMLGHLAELAAQELRADVAVHGDRGNQRGAGAHERLRPGDPGRPGTAADGAPRSWSWPTRRKFEQVAPGFVAGLDEVDVLVTDDAVTDATLAVVRERVGRVIVAASGPDAATASSIAGAAGFAAENRSGVKR